MYKVCGSVKTRFHYASLHAQLHASCGLPQYTLQTTKRDAATGYDWLSGE